MNPTHLRIALWAVTLALCGIGLVMVASTTTLRGAGEALNYRQLMLQGVALGIGLAGALFISAIGVANLRRWWLVGALAAGVMALLAVVPSIGREINGAFRWIELGPVRIQPSELAKVALVIVGAWYLVKVKERVRVHWNGVLLPLLGFGVVAFLVYRTKDLGSVVVMAGVLWSMLFFAGARWLYSTVLAICCLPLAMYVTVFSEGYRRDRVIAFMDPWHADGPAGYHLRQSYLAIASGGEGGVGLGQSASKQGFLPEFHTDFIYAIICEELGIIGGLAVAGLFLALVAIGLFIADMAKDRHARLLAIGATMLLGGQAFWNMLVVTGAVPTKGLTLPFISYGGTSLVASLALVGLLDAVCRTLPTEPRIRRTVTSRLGAAPLRRPTETA